jgi:hypothetical protein
MDGQKQLRQTLGILGILLPITDFLFGLITQGPSHFQSISATHYDGQYILFEGLVFAVSLFLITYRGYDIKDFWLSTTAGAGGLTLTLFPCALGGAEVRNFLMLPMNITTKFHFIGAFVFFASLAWIILFQFTKKVGTPSKQKQFRNKMYTVLGIIMVAGLIFGFGSSALFGKYFGQFIYVGETIALWSFGLAWCIKGEFFLKDKI